MLPKEQERRKQKGKCGAFTEEKRRGKRRKKLELFGTSLGLASTGVGRTAAAIDASPRRAVDMGWSVPTSPTSWNEGEKRTHLRL